MWNCWKTGQSLNAIGRALGKDQHVIHFLLARVTAGSLHPPSTDRQLYSPGRTRRHLPRDRQWLLDAVICPTAESRLLHSRLALRPKPCLLVTYSKLQEIVTSKLMQDWAPEQISRWLKQHYSDDESLRVSHETKWARMPI